MPTVASKEFSVKNGDPTNNVCVVLNTDGTTAIGVGTDTPQYALDVVGTSRFATQVGPSLLSSPSAWTNGQSGLGQGWYGTRTNITGTQTLSFSAPAVGVSGVYFEGNFTGLTGNNSSTFSTFWAQLNTDTGSFNMTNKIRAGFAFTNYQASGGTYNKIETQTGLTQTAVGSAGTISAGYGTSGELIHYGNGTITDYQGLFGTVQIQGNGTIGTGYGAKLDLSDDTSATGTATGTYTTAGYGAIANVTHASLTTMPLAVGFAAALSNSATTDITAARAFSAQINWSNTGNSTNALAHYVASQIVGSGGAVDGGPTNYYGFQANLALNGIAATGATINQAFGAAYNAPTFGANSTGTITTVWGIKVFGQVNGLTAATLTGGYAARGIEIVVPTQGGNTSGTNTNTGLLITGNGGTAGAGGTVTNRAINSTSTASSVILGGMAFGNISLQGQEIVAITGTQTAVRTSGLTWKALSLRASTMTITSMGAITTATGFNLVEIATPAIVTDAGGAITRSATLAILGPPGISGGGSITTAYALDVQTGNVGMGGLISLYNNIVTGGNGVPSEVKVTRPAQQTNTTVTLATYTTPAADGSYEIQANINVTVSTTVTMTVTCSYTDEANVARVLTMPFFLLAGTLVQSITTAQGNIAYSSMPITIRTKASTSITIATAGTVTAVTYTGEGIIKQLA